MNQGNEDEVEVTEEVNVPNLTGMTLKEAEETVKELGLEINIEGVQEENIEELDKENVIITEQTPIEGIKVNKGNKIFVKY